MTGSTSYLQDVRQRQLLQETTQQKPMSESSRGGFWDVLGLAQKFWTLDCCCACGENDQQSTIVPAPTSADSPVLLNAGVVDVGMILKEREGRSSSRDYKQQSSPIGMRSEPTKSPVGSARAANSDSPGQLQDPEASKAQLQRVMADFLRNAWKGMPCIYIEEQTGQRHSTRYFLDKQLSYLVVAGASGEASVPNVRCPIGVVQDLFTIDDGQEMFPEKVLGLCTQNELAMILMVSLNVEKSGSGPSKFCIIADSAADRDTFLDCMTVLVTYAQSQTRLSA